MRKGLKDYIKAVNRGGIIFLLRFKKDKSRGQLYTSEYLFGMKHIVILLFLFVPTAEIYSDNDHLINIDQGLRLKPLTENVWIHISDNYFPKWGIVSANGMVVITDEQLILIDTPWSSSQTQVLLEWFQNNVYQFDDVKVIVCHYHDDNLGGLNWVHENNIVSYAIERTQNICAKKNLPVPNIRLSESYRFDFEETPIEIYYPGEGHTGDSICVYLPQEKILFGGCSVKALNNTSLGNTADANVLEWPNTLNNMKERFPDVKTLVPGHGKEGDISLIDHTLALF